MSRKRIAALEQERNEHQQRLDGLRTKAERNRLGQFATPTRLAREILEYASSTLLPARGRVNFLDPAIGSGAFYSALLSALPKKRIGKATGFEIDPEFGKAARRLWDESGLTVKVADFTTQKPKPEYDLVICNPPYVRHHHLSGNDKVRLQRDAAAACQTPIGGLSGLYCYFVGLSHSWLAPDAVSGWLIPSEFMDVNYGRALKRYLLDRVMLLRVHRFDPNDVQFDDALVSSAVVWFKNAPAPPGHSVRFTFGGTLSKPKLSRDVTAAELAKETKWTRFPIADVRRATSTPPLSDFFKIKRGLATGDNSYFILPEAEIAERGLPLQLFTPVFPGPRHVPTDEIVADKKGVPLIDRRLFLLDTRLPEEEIEKRYPALWSYLEQGKARRLDKTYLCSHRKPWYAQEERPAPPIFCTYLGRGDLKSGRPFRFVLNHSRATVANVWLAMYPTPLLAGAMKSDPGLIRRIWQALNKIPPDALLGEGRVYGGGLHKLEPRELGNVRDETIAALIPDKYRPLQQTDLFAVAAE